MKFISKTLVVVKNIERSFATNTLKSYVKSYVNSNLLRFELVKV